MSPNLSIVINGRSFTHEAIVKINTDPFPPFEKSILSFCREWIGGVETFTTTTSGSTGTPKTITFSRKQMIASAHLTEEALQLRPGMTALLCLDPDFIAGKMMLVRSLTTQMNIHAVSPSANPLLDIAPEVEIDFAAFVPYQINKMLDSNSSSHLDKIGIVIIGGSEIDERMVERLQARNCSCYATFGMTETLSHVALRKLNGPDRSLYFKGLPGVRFGKDERACLTIEALHLSNERIITNDLVQLIDDSTFKWVGRWDNVINTGSIKVIPEQLETVVGSLLQSEKIENRFFIHHQPHPLRGQAVVLILEGNPDVGTAKRAMNVLKLNLKKFEVPHQILYIPAFKETSTGKINRKATAALASPLLPNF